MTLLQAITLGVLQGLTEFLPVSSSGHLVLGEHLLNVHIEQGNMQVLNILLHAGTLLALLLAYAPVWRDLLLAPWKKDEQSIRRLALLILATFPAAVIGVLFEQVIAGYFQSLLSVGVAFACTGLVLILGECCPNHRDTLLSRLLHPMKQGPHILTTRSALLVGVAQAFALVPGLSRSGLTISTGRLMGLNRKDALDFSFLMATPIIAGASVMSLKDLLSGSVTLPSVTIVTLAVAVSFATSLLAIIFLRSFVVRRSLAWFAPYLFVVAALTVFLHFSV